MRVLAATMEAHAGDPANAAINLAFETALDRIVGSQLEKIGKYMLVVNNMKD